MCTSITLSSKYVLAADKPTFIIAEIGQNHQGCLNIAKQLICRAKECGADCVKFQKSNLSAKFTEDALNAKYTSPHAFGETYGAHKAYLEFSRDDFIELQRYAQEIGILFTASAMDPQSLKLLYEMRVPFIKIGSGDANNLPMIEEAARMHIPLIISTGMQTFDTVKKIYNIVSKHHLKFVLMHCVSTYPTPLDDINLSVINLYQEEFKDVLIGYSGHEIGLTPTLAAVTLGAKVIERHFTLDKLQKGSDHCCSLEPSELQQIVVQIRQIERALGLPIKQLQPSELACRAKLGKSIVAACDLAAGMILDATNINIKVAQTNGRGIDAEHYTSLIGRKLCMDVDRDKAIIWQALD